MNSKFKRVMTFLLAGLLLFGTTAMAFAEESTAGEGAGSEVVEKAEAVWSGQRVAFGGRWLSGSLAAIDGKAYLPLAGLVDLLGIGTSYDEETGTLTLTTDWDASLYRGTADLVFSNGTRYAGGFENGLFEGEGELVFPDGSRYEGRFSAGAFSGAGRYEAPNGDVYEGLFQQDAYNGYGAYTYANGDCLEGVFKEDALEGWACADLHGTDETEQIRDWEWEEPFQVPDRGAKAFEQGRSNGIVDLVHANGDRYKGGMTDGVRNGYGVLSTWDGKTYKGNWAMGEQSGYGTLELADGTLYRGHFKSGVYDGYGKIAYPDGNAYDGGWKQGRPEGYGKYTEANGNAFYGMWQDGLKHTLSEKDDEDFKGYGTYTVNRKNTSDGETGRYKQKWSEGRLLRERKDN